MYDNQNLSGGLESILKSYSVIKTLSYITIKDCSEMLKMHYTNIVPLTKEQYDLDSYEHYTYTNASNTPLIIRYAEISIIKQITPGRLDDIPLGYPDFDSTADGVLTRKGPLPAPPYTDFSTATGATFNVSIIPGESISFKDTTVKTPWQFAPTGWGWVFGPTASPTGSNLQNPIVTYGATGIYTVTLTAYNAAGQTTKTKNNFVIVTSI
jgi:PKD repeat protein